VLTKRESEKFAEDDRIAIELANKRGRPFAMGAAQAAIVAAVAVFVMLDVFAALTLSDRESAVWPVISLTAFVAAGTYIVVRQKEKKWIADYNEALRRVRAERT
jgi:hypothetical protein